MVDYLNHMKSISDSLYSIGHPIDDNDIILQILAGLPSEYSDVIIVMSTRKHLPTFLELRSFLLAHESRLQDAQIINTVESSQAYFVSRGRGNYNRGGWHKNNPRGG